MCGRYTLTAEADELAAEFDLVEPIPLAARYNIAPTQRVPVVRFHAAGDAPPKRAVVRITEPGGVRRLDILRWGLVPHWAKDLKFGFRTINARAETVATQPAFREAFRSRRCLVPASGFYEWQRAMEDGKEVKQPRYIRRVGDKPMALAGLWESWTAPDGEVVETFTIITTSANDAIRPFHDRMPVILRSEDYEAWLNPATKPDALKALLVPCPADWLSITSVSRRVNSPGFDDPDCIVALT